jgi:hypothetical protein
MKRWLMAGAAALVLGLAGATARAEEPVVFDLSLRGIEAAVLSFTGTVEGNRYSVAGRLQSAGLVGMLKAIRYEGASQGTVRGTRFTPQRYVEKADTGRRKSVAEMRYSRGVPQIKSYDPPREAGEAGLDPATQGGTVDPLTAMFAVLRDAPEGQECNVALTLFDGERRSLVQLGAPQAGKDGGLTCPGEYRRLEGFSAEDMAERTRFPFTLTLSAPADGLRRATEVRMETLYGRAVMTRRAGG